MASSMNFGEMLRNARERKGMDLATASRLLRIRPDIIRSIEENDFERMPPRGYTQNMIKAYARLVGLDGTEITHMYLDDAYAFDVERARVGSRRASQNFSRSRSSDITTTIDRQPLSGSFGRLSYDDYTDENGRTYAQDRVHPSRSTSVPTTQYTNFYAGPSGNSDLISRLPFIIGGIILIIIIIILLVFFLGGNGEPEEVPDVPITGLTDTSDGTDSGDTGTTTPVVTAPTSALFTYSVPEGQTAYIEIYENGSDTPSVAQDVTGPASQTYDVTGTLRFTTTNPESVALTLDGQAVEPTEGASGVYNYNVDFSQILAQWNSANNPAAAGGVNTGTQGVQTNPGTTTQPTDTTAPVDTTTGAPADGTTDTTGGDGTGDTGQQQ